MDGMRHDDGVAARLGWAVMVATGAQPSLERAVALHLAVPRILAVAAAVASIATTVPAEAPAAGSLPVLAAGFALAVLLWYVGTLSRRALHGAHARLVRAVFDEADRCGRAAALVLARDAEPLGGSWWLPWAPIRAARALRQPDGWLLAASVGSHRAPAAGLHGRSVTPPSRSGGARQQRAERRRERTGTATRASVSARSALSALAAIAELSEGRDTPVPDHRRTTA